MPENQDHKGKEKGQRGSTLSVGGVNGGAVQATPVLPAAQTLFDNLRVNPGVGGSPTEQSVEQNHRGHRN